MSQASPCAVVAPLAQGFAATLKQARAEEADWVFLLGAGERVAPDLFAQLAPALDGYDAIWGAIAIEDRSGALSIPHTTRFACSDEVSACHMALHWWVGRSHMVRAEALHDAPGHDGETWYARYLLHQWRNVRCLKTAQPLTLAAALPQISEAEKAFILAELAARPRYIGFEHGGRLIKLPYTGANPTLERVQLRGLFYEAEELSALKERIPTGATIVDVGANTGNHTIYFAAIMGARRVLPIEANPRACTALRAAVAANALANVDLSKLGIGAGAQAGVARPIVGQKGHLGTVTLALDQSASGIPVAPLDTLVDGHVDLIKIDAEGMEIDVVQGARGLIANSRPVLLIEVADARLASFQPLMSELGYRAAQIFPDYGYANYLMVPVERG